MLQLNLPKVNFMDNSLYQYYVQNGHLVDRRYFLPSAAESTVVVYEVLRLMEGVPLFLDSHLHRLEQSARLVGRMMNWSPDEIIESIRRLIDANDVRDGNIKILVQWEDGGKGDLYLCFIPHAYPPEADYARGVAVALLEAERETPNAKVQNLRIREQADAIIRREGVYEVLYVDHEGFITEGSRSNIFMISGEMVITPPARSVLMGITRQEVLNVCNRLGIPVSEERIHRKELASIDGVFLTGTSPGVLPVSRVDTFTFPAGHPLITRIREGYLKRVQQQLDMVDQ